MGSMASTDTGHGREYTRRVLGPEAHEPHAAEAHHHHFTSHARMQREKMLCRMDVKHTHHWDRLEQGSAAGHSAGGSDFGSIRGEHMKNKAASANARTSPTKGGNVAGG